ncbi:unnamed protein product [Natator depressus]
MSCGYGCGDSSTAVSYYFCILAPTIRLTTVCSSSTHGIQEGPHILKNLQGQTSNLHVFAELSSVPSLDVMGGGHRLPCPISAFPFSLLLTSFLCVFLRLPSPVRCCQGPPHLLL